MRTSLLGAIARLSLFAMVSAVLVVPAWASIKTASLLSGNATVSSVPVNPANSVDFVSFGGAYPGNVFDNALISPGVAELGFTTVLPADYSPPPADRLILNVTNNTGAPLASFAIALSGASIYGSVYYPGVYDSTLNQFVNSAGIASSASGFTYNFSTPLPVNGSAAFYIPLEYSSQLPTSFVLTEQSGVVPEPATLIVWSILGSLAVGLGWWRARKAA
jgi:hypothetical protein